MPTRPQHLKRWNVYCVPYFYPQKLWALYFYQPKQRWRLPILFGRRLLYNAKCFGDSVKQHVTGKHLCLIVGEFWVDMIYLYSTCTQKARNNCTVQHLSFSTHKPVALHGLLSVSTSSRSCVVFTIERRQTKIARINKLDDNILIPWIILVWDVCNNYII